MVCKQYQYLLAEHYIMQLLNFYRSKKQKEKDRQVRRLRSDHIKGTMICYRDYNLWDYYAQPPILGH